MSQLVPQGVALCATGCGGGLDGALRWSSQTLAVGAKGYRVRNDKALRWA